MDPTNRPCVAAVVVDAVAVAAVVAAAVNAPLRLCRFEDVFRPLFSCPCLLSVGLAVCNRPSVLHHVMRVLRTGRLDCELL